MCCITPDKRGHKAFFTRFSSSNIYCGYSLEVPCQCTSNEYHKICFCGEIRKISILFGERSTLSRTMFCSSYILSAYLSYGLGHTKMVFGHMQTVSMQSDQGIHCPLTESIEYYRVYEWRAKAHMVLWAYAG